MTWEPRTYRHMAAADDLIGFQVMHAETDLHISASHDLSRLASALVADLRADIERYIVSYPHFAESFAPVAADASAPEIVRAMCAAGAAAGVGPMAAVAGAIAERVAFGLESYSREVIVENGGDLYLVGRAARRVLLVAGDSPLSGAVAIELASGALPVAVCTSSGRVGHSISLGDAHAMTVLATDGALADAVATAAGNRVHGPGDIERALAFAVGVGGVRGAVAIAGDRIGAMGDVRLTRAGA